MTFEQLLAEVAAQPTQEKAFQVLIDCLKIEHTDAAAGNSPPPSIQAKYDEIYGTAFNKANLILHAIEDGKPALDPLPVKEAPAFDPSGPMSPTAKPAVFVDRPRPVDAPAQSPFSGAHDPVADPVNDGPLVDPVVPHPDQPTDAKPVAPIEETK
jgi:hypothetical protein